MSSLPVHAVTGAFGYSGRFIAARLLAAGRSVLTLTNSNGRKDPFDGRVRVAPLTFEEPERLMRALLGVDVLYNTYWVRFNHRRFSHAAAVRNTQVLFDAARRAGVRRVVHVSITNPDEESPLEYFAGKGRLERVLRESGMEYAILRPAVLFGGGDILINNIAWALRRFPWFAVFGDGSYRLQPIHVDDLAELAVGQGVGRGNVVIEAIGPETFAYADLVRAVGAAIGCERRLVQVSPDLGYALCRMIGWWVRDKFLTRGEIRGLMEGRLCVDAPPAGATRVTEWLRANREAVGRWYASELARRSGGGG
jgi:NADH dehydrogenase